MPKSAGTLEMWNLVRLGARRVRISMPYRIIAMEDLRGVLRDSKRHPHATLGVSTSACAFHAVANRV